MDTCQCDRTSDRLRKQGLSNSSNFCDKSKEAEIRLLRTIEQRFSLKNQVLLFKRLVNSNFRRAERTELRSFCVEGELGITMDEYYSRVFRRDTQKKSFRFAIVIGPGMTRNEKRLLGRDGRAFLPVDESTILGRAYNKNYERKRVLDLFKGLRVLYSREDVCAILDDFELDEARTEYYLRSISYCSRKACGAFFSRCLVMSREERKSSKIWNKISLFRNNEILDV